eukprot:TRINITY_DN207_c0_g1_i2.p1 TRINITY_DN207_c0_g1~~TRINITY_DN207_c0_g1_i2.p1  ORF type:complete len:1285 (+),score=600.12 TRINITY_DN207_c0_g1_i2:110-3856(+)
MGCGGSAAKDDGKGKKSDEKYKEDKPAEKKEKSAPAPAAAPAASPAPAPAAAPAAPTGAALPGREKHMPGPLMAVIGDSKDKECQYLVSAFGHLGDVHGFTLSCASSKTGDVYASVQADADLQAAVGKLHDALAGDGIENFFKMLSSCFSKQDIKVSDGGAKLELKLKGKAEPKEVKWTPSLDKQSGAANAYKTVVAPLPKFYCQVKKGGGGDDKKPSEAELAKKESELGVHEAILVAGAAAEEAYAEELADLRGKAHTARGSVQAQRGRIMKISKEIEGLKLGAASHPLDDMYACTAPTSREPQACDVGSLTWDSDVLEAGYNLTDLGCALFQHWELFDWKVEKTTAANFFTALEERCNKVGPYHGPKRCADCLVSMHVILSALKKTNAKISKEDTLAAFLSAGSMDLDHPGFDNTSIKRAGTMFAMVYSDLYMNGQNNLTALFEMMYNAHVNLLAKLTPDEAKDVFETVREALFIKANVAMKTNMERLKDFEDLIGKGADWGAKDNVRHQITHAARMCDWAAWAKGEALHKKWLDKFKEEFYAQGDFETSIGIAHSKFGPCCTGYGSNILDRFETRWTCDRERDAADFASGQVNFIERCVEPLAVALARVAPDLENIAAAAKGNRQVWEKAGGASSAGLGDGYAKTGKMFGATADAVVAARLGTDGASLWVTACDTAGGYHQGTFDGGALAKCGAADPSAFLEAFAEACKSGSVKGAKGGAGYTVEAGGAKLELGTLKADGAKVLIATGLSFVELRGMSAMKYVDRKIEELAGKAKAKGNPAEALEGEAKALKGCLLAMEKQEGEMKARIAELEKELSAAGGTEPKVDEEDSLEIKVRNPLKCPLPKDGSAAPDRKAVDTELLKTIKSAFFCKPHAPADLEKEPDPASCHYVSAIQPYVSSEYQKMAKSIGNEKTQHVVDLLKKLDDWDYDVFDLQTTMSGGISGENLRNQPDGGALYITMYALVYKWQFMQKYNVDENKMLNWLSIVEAGYHPNPYHNSMHAADVLHIVHYCLGPGGGQAKLKCSDEKVFAAILSGAVHDFNHPGINNAFHVRCQNYLAVLFNDRSVNENIHASSIFELMRMDKFNVLSSFKGEAYDKMRDDMVEFILGTDMGLHAMILSRFKKRIEETDSKLHKIESDVNLGITMCVKLADISNCGRPQKLYHGWCNVIVDEFFQQGDRERLQGMAVSPFMDRFTTVMAKGQIGFMNYIVAPLFECMAEWLEGLSCASSLAEENKGFWQENEDW